MWNNFFRNNNKNYYAILGVHPYASDEEITRAFRHLSLQYHPDRNKAPDAITKFKEINEAYHILVKSKNAQHYEAIDPKIVEKNLKIAEEIRKSQKGALEELEKLKHQNAAYEDFFSCVKCKTDISDGGIVFNCGHKSCIYCSNTEVICHRCNTPIQKRLPFHRF